MTVRAGRPHDTEPHTTGRPTEVTGRGQDELRWPMQLAEQLIYLAGEVTGSDFAPTASQREVGQLLGGQVREARARLDAAMAGPVAAFRQFLRSRSLASVVF